MKILYAFSGHGYGHAVRSSVVINYLKSLGHEVRAATFGQGLELAQKIKLTEVIEIEGYRMYYGQRGLSISKTLLKFLNQSPKVIFSNLTKFNRALNIFKPDLIISDFEPFSAYWSKWKDIPLIKINNQSVITLTKIKIPAKFLSDYLTTQTIITLFAPRAQANFILSFSPELTPIRRWYRKKSFLVPPILREKVLSLQPNKGDFILVYQTSSVYQKKLLQIFSQFSQIKFYFYNLNLASSSANNLVIKNFSEEEFLNDLANCRAVITNGGFTVISEAIYLHKPILSLPIKRDFEQILNAILLERCSYGKFGQKINSHVLQDFLANLDFYENNLKNYQQEGNKIFEEKLKEILENIK